MIISEPLGLDDTEKTVIILLVLGWGNERIAQRLHCQTSSVGNYRKTAHDKARKIVGEDKVITLPMVLGLAMVQGEITCMDLLRAFTSPDFD